MMMECRNLHDMLARKSAVALGAGPNGIDVSGVFT